MSSHRVGDEVTATARVAHELGACPRELLAQLPLESVQALTAAAVRAYAAAQERGIRDDPVAEDAVSATEAVLLCRGLMHAADIELFELSMWGNIREDASDGEGSNDLE